MDYGAATLDRIVSSVWRTDDFGRLLGKLERYLPSNDLVFVDECGSTIALTPLYARSPRGQRARGAVPRNWGKTPR